MLASGEQRFRGGTYDDSPAEHYSWDSRVPMHREPQPGDAVVISDGTALLGASVIDTIAQHPAEKEIRTCPECGSGRFKPRKTKTPVYIGTNCKHEFDEPKTRTEPVTAYRALYASAWMDLAGRLTHNELRDMTEKPKSQQAIRPIRIDELWAKLDRPRVTPFEAAVARWAAGGHATRLARVRLGQASFRRQLVGQFGLVCAFTGPGPGEALEAAHLYSFAKSGRHHPHGGWLMRSDLHQLFDVGHVAVHPDDLVVDVAADVRRYPGYAALHGQGLRIAVEDEHVEWLRLHWTANR